MLAVAGQQAREDPAQAPSEAQRENLRALGYVN
jgi:hypothetical protein